ncbi:MAG: hypothetical protein ABSB10_04555 [Candidatus Bathyarchaeia archaeon]
MYVVKEKPPEDTLAIYPVKSDFQGIGSIFLRPFGVRLKAMLCYRCFRGLLAI